VKVTVTYCTAEDVSMYYRGGQHRTQADATLTADSGLGEFAPHLVVLSAADAGQFYVGARVTVYDDANPRGEEGTISAIVFNGASSYLQLSADLAALYTTTNSGKVKLRGFFNKDTTPDIQTVERIINDAEDWIDAQTNDAWRSTTVTEEYHRRDWRRSSFNPGLSINLRHTDITTFVSGTDKIEIWNGAEWEEWVATKTEGRGDDYWVNYTEGTLFIRSYWFLHQTDAVRMTYRYGHSTVPNDLRKCCALIVARDLLEQEQHLMNLPGDGQGHTFELAARVAKYQKQIDTIISRHRREIFFLK